MTQRLPAAILFVLSAGLLGTALALSPDAAGVGTHEQLGLPPCGFLERSGIPCVSCGMTTSYAHATRGNLLQAFVTQPAGTLLAVLTAVTVVVSGFALVRGLDLSPLAQVVLRPKVLLIAGLVAVISWGYKILVTTGMV